MLIRDISDEDLSRWIADKFEPKPDFNITKVSTSEWVKRDLRISPNWNGSTTSVGMWIWRGLHIGEWQPRDIVNDPSMTMMLLEKSKLSLIALDQDTWMCGQQWMNGTVALYANAAKSKSLGRAVAEAFALANGFLSGD